MRQIGFKNFRKFEEELQKIIKNIFLCRMNAHIVIYFAPETNITKYDRTK